MRTLFYIDNAHRMGGSQRSLLAAMTRGRDYGLDPVVVSTSAGPFVEACKSAAINVRLLEGSDAFATFGKALLRLGPLGKAAVAVRELLPYAMRLARVIDSERADVVHFNTLRALVMAGIGPHLAGRRVLFHLRGTPPVGAGLWAFAQSLTHRFILVAHALESFLLPSSRTRSSVVHNGIALLDRLPNAKKQLLETYPEIERTLPGSPIVASLSSLVPFKGLHHLIRSAALLKGRGVDVRLVFAGTGLGDTYEAHLRSLPAQFNVQDRVHFIGFIEDAHALLSGVDILALPSIFKETLELSGDSVEINGNEGLPRSVLEAMNAGTFAIATDVAGVREQIIDGETGYVVPPGDAAAFADAIEAALSNPIARSRMSQNAKERICGLFSIEAAARGLVSGLELTSRDASRGSSAKNIAGALFDSWNSLWPGRQG